METEKYVLVVAGGKGLRMGKELPKQFLLIGGKPILMHTIACFFRYDARIRIILVIPKDHQAYWKSLCETYRFDIPHLIADGGESRFHSVRNGLEKVTRSGLVAVHDGVRPFVSKEVIKECFDQANRTGTAIPVMPLVESLRTYETNGSHAVDRNRYCSVQTPQVFHSELLKKAYIQPFKETYTDDASVVEAYGIPVTLTSGNPENIKITTPFDLAVGELLLTRTR